MILVKTANESTYFSVFNHRLKFWTLKFSAPQLLQKTFAPHDFPLNNICLHVPYLLLKFVPILMGHPVYATALRHSVYLLLILINFTNIPFCGFLQQFILFFVASSLKRTGTYILKIKLQSESTSSENVINQKTFLLLFLSYHLYMQHYPLKNLQLLENYA